MTFLYKQKSPGYKNTVVMHRQAVFCSVKEISVKQLDQYQPSTTGIQSIKQY